MGAGAGAKGAARFDKDKPAEELGEVAVGLPAEQQIDLALAANDFGLRYAGDWAKAAEEATSQQKDKIWVEMEVKYGQRFGRKPPGVPEGYVDALRNEYVNQDGGAYSSFMADNPPPEEIAPLLGQIEAQVRDSDYPNEVIKSLEKAWSAPARITDWEWLEARDGSWTGAADAIIQKLKDAGVKRGQITSIDAHNNDPDSDAIFSAHFSKSLPDGGDLSITYDVQNTADYGWEQFYNTALEQASTVPTADVVSITSSCNSGGAAVTFVFKYDPAAADEPSRPLTWMESRSMGSDWAAAAKDIIKQIEHSGAQKGQVLCIDAHNFGGQRAENEEELQEKRDQIASLQDDVGKLTATIDDLKEDIKQAEASLVNNKESQARETAQREEGKNLMEASVQKLVDADKMLKSASEGLTAYFDEFDKKKAPPEIQATFESRKSKGGEAIQMIQSILKISEEEQNMARSSDEDGIQSAYEARMTALKNKESALEGTIQQCKEDITNAENTIAEKKDKIKELEASAAENEDYLSKRKAGDAIFTAFLDLEKPSKGPLEILFHEQHEEYPWEKFYDEASKYANTAREDDAEFSVFNFTSCCSKGGKAVQFVFYEKKPGIVRFMPKPECICLDGYLAALRAEYVDHVNQALGDHMVEKAYPEDVCALLEPHIEAQVRSSPNPDTVIAALKRAWTK